ncbi:MAG: flavodoxin family protein [Deltaproteobacteria bacterium]|jgi:multimeric flavodoxin WrbA|nr:flavodoxin family protein [Deltaproteobacteria bacterium]
MDKDSAVEILGLHLSPRKHGSSYKLLEEFEKGARVSGAGFKFLSVSDLNIKGCLGCNQCARDGKCVITDDDMKVIYGAWENATRIVISTSIFFYDMPSQGKAILDRSQANWSRRYVLKETSGPKPDTKGFLLAVGATKGQELFTPVTLAVRYLFDSLSFPKSFTSLLYRSIEGPKDFTEEQLLDARKAGELFAKA